MVTGDLILPGLRRFWTLRRKIILQYKTINLGIGRAQIENVLWRIKNIVLPMFMRSVVIHCDTKNISTSSSNEIILGVVTIVKSISHCYSNIEVIVSDLLPRDIHWSTWRVKINKTNAYLRDYCQKSNKMTFIYEDPDWTYIIKILHRELYYKDHLHLIENRNIKFSKSITEILQDVFSRQSSSQLSSSYLSQSSLIIFPPPSFLLRSNILSVKTILSPSPPSQSLSATATPFNQKRHFFLLNFPTPYKS